MSKEDIDYTQFIPEEPPKELFDEVYKRGKLKADALVYKTAYVNGKKCIQVTCSACGKSYYREYTQTSVGCWRGGTGSKIGFIDSRTNEKHYDYSHAICSECGATTEVYHSSNFYSPYRIICNYFPTYLTLVNGLPALICWRISRHIFRDGHKADLALPYEAYVFEKKKCIKIMGYTKTFERTNWCYEWRQMKKCIDTLGETEIGDIYGMLSSDSLDGTVLENSKLFEYLKRKGKYPVTYLRIYQKHKQIENLVMQGLIHIIDDRIKATNNTYWGKHFNTNITGINFKETKPAKMLGINKTELSVLKKRKWTFEDLDIYRELKTYGICPEDLRLVKNYSVKYHLKNLLKYEASVMRAVRYLEKQKEKYKRKENCGLRELIDYWEMAEKNGVDLSDVNEKYPQNIKTSHDLQVKITKHKEDEALKVKFEERYQELQKYEYKEEGLMIIPAKCESDFITEGKLLHHCVGGYAKRHANGETAIFFVRHTDKPDDPYFTLEFDERNCLVRQNRGKHNCSRTEDVKEFEKHFIKFAKDVQRKEKKNGKHNDKIRKSA